ncbi:MAG TPA: HAD family phosphatase [Sphingomicrobium sp.]|nr:HAD family phosphatase [Sphingomicrobium sp.]
MHALDAIIFDFDGVLLDSEFAGNRRIAEILTELGHRHSTEDALRHYIGLNGEDFIAAVERRIGESLPREFHLRMREEGTQALRSGVRAVAGAAEFVRALPARVSRAVASSSSTRWLRGHLDHLGLREAFEPHIYSGREHVARGKPAPDLYLFAAQQLGVPIERCVIIEDSPVGVQGALASGARVVGLAAGSHCLDGHADMLRSLGVEQVATSFAELRSQLELD